VVDDVAPLVHLAALDHRRFARMPPHAAVNALPPSNTYRRGRLKSSPRRRQIAE